jgi:replicative DNA helicase
MSLLDKLPNPSPESERIVLSCMMQDPANSIPFVIERNVGPEAFRGQGHRTLAESLRELFHQRRGCDLASVTQHLIDRNLIDACCGVAGVTEIAVAAPTMGILPEHVDEVRRKALLMTIWKTCHDIMATASSHADEGNPDQMLDDVEQAFYNLRASFQKQDELLKPAKEFINQALNQFESAYKARGTGVIGVPSGFVDLDRMCNGFKGGQLIVLAARPSMGKSAFAMNILQSAAEQGHGSALFSLEMSGMEMAQRMICATADVSLQRVRDGFLNRKDFPRITSAGSTVSQQNIWIDETPSLSLYALRARARRLKMQSGIGLIVIDYLQLMRCPSKRGDANRALEIADITGGLKTLAKELNIPIIALAQLNREAERRGEPKLSDLRESGSIEQDADIVLLMHRNKDEDNMSPQGSKESDEDYRRRIPKLYVAKQRNGPVGTIDLRFDGEKTRFLSCTDSAYSNAEEHRQSNYKKNAV